MGIPYVDAKALKDAPPKLNTSVGAEAFANHPAKGYLSEAVPRLVRDRSSTNVCAITKSDASLPCIEEGRDTRMTPSKPDFAHVCLLVIQRFGVVGVSGVPMVDLVSGTTFIERHCVAEIANGGIGVCEGEGMRYHTNGTDSVPVQRIIFKRVNERRNLERYQAPRKSTLTSTEKASLKCLLCCHPISSSRVYILYAKGTCW